MRASLRGAGVVPVLVVISSVGCGLEASGLGGLDGAGEVDVAGDVLGDWVPEGDIRREDAAESDDVELREDISVEDVEDPVEVADDGGEEDDGGPIPDGCAVESCNGLDDDCDGRPDDGFECAIGTVDFCGPCGEGRSTCVDCVWSVCSYPPELCAPGTVEACTPSSCEVGHRTCEPSCRWTACVADHSECTPGATQSCSIPSCGTGSQTCQADCSWGACRYECSRDWEDCCPGVGCVNLDSDIRNCGACGHDCGSWSICWFGDCS